MEIELTPTSFAKEAGGDALGERRAVDQFKHEGTLFDAVDRGDVGVVQRCQNLCFARETGEAIGIGGEGVGENFDGDIAVELGVSGAVDNAHTAFAELRDDSEVCDRLLRAHRVVQGMVSLSGRITGFAEVMPVLCPPVDVRWAYRKLAGRAGTGADILPKSRFNAAKRALSVEFHAEGELTQGTAIVTSLLHRPR